MDLILLVSEARVDADFSFVSLRVTWTQKAETRVETDDQKHVVASKVAHQNMACSNSETYAMSEASTGQPDQAEMRRTTCLLPARSDEAVRTHARQLSLSLGGARVTYQQSLTSLIAIAAGHLGIWPAQSRPPQVDD